MYRTLIVRTSFAILKQLRPVSRSLTQDMTQHLVHSLILSNDHCIVTIADSHSPVSFAIKAAANLAVRMKEFDLITPVLQVLFSGST